MSLLEALRCPICHRAIELRGHAAICATHGHFPRDVNGIISFLKDRAGYFERHWSDNQDIEIPNAKKGPALRFLAPLVTRSNKGATARQVWLDVGCGDGVHLSILQSESANNELVALDISYPALRSIRRHVTSAILLHADAQNIPLCDGSADATFAYGVLAYLPDPWRGLAEMVRVTKPNGLVGVWFFPRRADILGRAFDFVRSIVPKLPAFMQARFADLLVPLLGFLPTHSGVSLKNASWGACREVILVNIAPANLLLPTEHEVSRKFEELGCEIIERGGDPITIWARRGGPRR